MFWIYVRLWLITNQVKVLFTPICPKKTLEENKQQKQPGGRFSARVFSLFFLDTPGMGSSFSVVFAMFFLVHVLFWCLKCCHLQWLPNVTIF